MDQTFITDEAFNWKSLYILSGIVAVVMAATSLAGLLFQSTFYPTEELRRSFVSNDVVNLFIGLPILLGSMWLARREKLIGLLFWPGALFYIAYNYLAYAIAMPLMVQFLVYLAVTIVSVYASFRLVSSMDATRVQGRLGGAVSERFVGGVLIGFGVLFLLRAISQGVSVLTGRISLGGGELGALAADLAVTPLWIFCGISLWRKRAFGYVTAAGLLFQASMLFIGLLIFFILQPYLTNTPFPLTDFVVVFVMGLVCFVPFGLFVRGVLSEGSRGRHRLSDRVSRLD